MSIENPRIHIICETCGGKDCLFYTSESAPDEAQGWINTRVRIKCSNCGFDTGYGEIIKQNEAKAAKQQKPPAKCPRNRNRVGVNCESNRMCICRTK